MTEPLIFRHKHKIPMVLLKVDYRKSFDREREELCLKVSKDEDVEIHTHLSFRPSPPGISKSLAAGLSSSGRAAELLFLSFIPSVSVCLGECHKRIYLYAPVPRVRVFPMLSLLRSEQNFWILFRLSAGFKQPSHFLLRSQVSKWALLATQDLGFLENPAPVS